jgi:hypothetical protein
MTEPNETALLNIYNRIAPKLQIPGLLTEVLPGDGYPEILIRSEDDRVYSLISLYPRSADDWFVTYDDGDIEKYRWEYLDGSTGALAVSKLPHTATDEEVIAFVIDTLQNHEGMMKP